MQPQHESEKQDDVKRDIKEIEGLTPFTSDDLKGVRFARGNMLGGASPLESAAPAPWEKDKTDQ